jgi:hypothetical protein
LRRVERLSSKQQGSAYHRRVIAVPPITTLSRGLRPIKKGEDLDFESYRVSPI